ncbi:MAG: type VI secretion system contractile sheath large subunit [Wenzhouxiangella sp.]|nr:type VI secretion system contractile sheath large subunit [Wenzhouxiangella sp.]TVR94828.1 MAG: hypothetical protein EA418_09345 [Wenzhouxiangellaceae bacterium]
MPISAEFSLGKASGSARRPDQAGLRMVLIGNWVGRASDNALSQRALGDRPMPRIDIDQFEQAMATMAPQANLTSGHALDFSSLDDFHPDSLCRRLPALRELLAIHRDLDDPGRAPALIEELRRQGLDGDPPDPEPEPTPASSDSSDLERLLGGRVEQAGQGVESGKLSQFLADVVGPHVVDSAAARPFRDAIAAELGVRVRSILGEPDFQALEARWRGLWWLISQLIGTDIELRLLQVDEAELATDLDAAGSELGQSGLFRQLFADQAASRGQILVWVDASVGSDDSLRHLAAMATMAGIAGGSLLAAARPALAGVESAAMLAESSRYEALGGGLAARWQSLRNSSVAPHVALVVPRLLARIPYGRATDAIESFPFEESPQAASDLCWMSGAFGLAAALGQAFLEHELELDPGAGRWLEDLPSFSHDQDGEKVLQPPVEVVLSEAAIDALARRGLCALMGSRHRIEVMLPGCLAITGGRLAGPWN